MYRPKNIQNPYAENMVEWQIFEDGIEEGIAALLEEGIKTEGKEGRVVIEVPEEIGKKKGTIVFIPDYVELPENSKYVLSENSKLICVSTNTEERTNNWFLTQSVLEYPYVINNAFSSTNSYPRW